MAAALRDTRTVVAPRAQDPPGIDSLNRPAVGVEERLFNLQLQFNLFPAIYAHRSWIERAALAAGRGDMPVCLPTSTFWVRGLSSTLLRLWQLDRQFDCDFFDPAKRLALLDAAALLRVGGLVGAVLLRHRLQRIVYRADVDVLQRSIGARAHRFALHWNKAAPTLPEWDRRNGGDWPAPDLWTARIVTLVTSAVPSHAIGVLGRLKLRFHYSAAAGANQRLRMTEAQRESLVRLFTAVIVEDCSEWAWLFESGTSGATRSPASTERSC